MIIQKIPWLWTLQGSIRWTVIRRWELMDKRRTDIKTFAPLPCKHPLLLNRKKCNDAKDQVQEILVLHLAHWSPRVGPFTISDKSVYTDEKQCILCKHILQIQIQVYRIIKNTDSTSMRDKIYCASMLYKYKYKPTKPTQDWCKKTSITRSQSVKSQK